MRVEIAAAASVLPEEVVTSEDVEARIRAQSPSLTVIPGSVRHVTGIETRRRACESINASDLAAEACRKVLEQAALESTAIDLLIYASASQDLVEPATAHIVQHKLGTRAAA